MAENRTRENLSSYNEGMFQIQRLHFLWIDANNKSRSGDLQGWRWTLETIWRELSRDAIEEGQGSVLQLEELKEKNEWFKTYNELRTKLNNNKTKMDLYEGLQNIEIFLRQLQDLVGKGGKYQDPGMDDFD